MNIPARLARLERRMNVMYPRPTRIEILFPGDPEPEAAPGEDLHVVRIEVVPGLDVNEVLRELEALEAEEERQNGTAYTDA